MSCPFLTKWFGSHVVQTPLIPSLSLARSPSASPPLGSPLADEATHLCDIELGHIFQRLLCCPHSSHRQAQDPHLIIMTLLLDDWCGQRCASRLRGEQAQSALRCGVA